ncbi:VanZ like family protein [Ruminococcaceae bacterium YRB3002]|nr:VanZ like family protein [Ruminococcaceae bacterium YRB3002]
MRYGSNTFSKTNALLAVIFWILTIVCVVMIFYFSSQTGDESSATSGTISRFLAKYFGGMVTETVVRKAAHILEFLALSFFTYLAIYNTNKISVETSYSESGVKIIKSDNEMCIIFTTWFSVLNAVVDEYHQLFVNGRSGSISDVAIDMIGVVVLMLIFRLIFTLNLKFKGKTEIRYNE